MEPLDASCHLASTFVDHAAETDLNEGYNGKNRFRLRLLSDLNENYTSENRFIRKLQSHGNIFRYQVYIQI